MSISHLPLAFVIEDDHNLSRAYAEAMNQANYRTVVIRNGLEALARLKEQVPSTVILDIHIPGVSGVEVLEYIRSDLRFNRVKVIITTADDRKAEELHDKADLVLIKPVGFLQLRDMAQRMHPAYS